MDNLFRPLQSIDNPEMLDSDSSATFDQFSSGANWLRVQTQSTAIDLTDPLMGHDFLAGTNASALFLFPKGSICCVFGRPKIAEIEISLADYLLRLDFPIQASYCIAGLVHKGWLADFDRHWLVFQAQSGSRMVITENLEWLVLGAVDNCRQGI